MNEMLNDLVMVVTADISSEYTAKYITHEFITPNKAVSIHPL
jgi:hypothetical protein